MEVNSAQFIISNSELSKCPKADRPEYAFIGRSNVGKSSLINMLCNRKKLAKTSSTPGKTQLINHFMINDEWYLVDLPGYGYAKSSKKDRAAWKRMIDTYLIERENLQCTFILIDARHKLQKIDLDFMIWMAEHGLAFAIIFTKADKLKKGELTKNIKALRMGILEYWEELPANFITSSEEKLGASEILNYIDKVNQAI